MFFCGDDLLAVLKSPEHNMKILLRLFNLNSVTKNQGKFQFMILGKYLRPKYFLTIEPINVKELDHGELNQQCSIYQTAGEKCVPSAQEYAQSMPKRHTTKRELMNQKRVLSMWNPREDRLQFLLNMTMLFVAYVRLF